MSQLEVDKVIPQSGTTLTLGDSADTITIPSGATLDASNATLTLPDGSVTSAKISYPLTTFSSTGIDDDGTSTAITINSSNNVALAGNIGLGGATPTTSGTGITFPATASASTNANTLDDYEEGTWTPVWSATSGSMTYSKQEGFYTKVGRVVHAHCHIITTANNSLSGAVQLDGLPFTNQNSFPAGSMFVENVNIGADITFFSYVQPLQSFAYFRYFNNNGSAVNVVGSSLNAGSDMMFNYTYFI